MRFGWLIRLAVLVSLISPIAFSQYCGFEKFALGSSGQAYCSLCAAIFGGPASPDNPLKMQIVPEWYLLPSFGMLRSITLDIGFVTPKALGLVALCGAFAAPLSLALYKWSSVPPRAWVSLVVIPVIVAGLGWVGEQPPVGPAVQLVGPLLAILYFLWFILVFPALARSREAHSR